MLYVTDIDNPAVGYTQAALQYMMGLHAVGYTNWHYIPIGGRAVQWRAMPPWCEPLSNMRQTDATAYDLAFIHHTPDNVPHPDLRRGKKQNIGFTVTETSRIPWWLAPQLNELDAVVTASRWNARVITEAGVSVPVHVVPHAVGRYWWDGVPAAPRGEEGRYVFYYAGSWNTRKNPADLVRAYLRAFPTNDGAQGLMLKLGMSKGQERFLQAIVEDETGSSARLDPDVGDIWVYSSPWRTEGMQWLHTYGDCYVSMHRGEGWGYGLMQAAMMGKPVLYTGWSAPTEFFGDVGFDDKDGVVPLPYELIKADAPGNVPYFQTMPGEAPLMWAQVDMAAAVEALREQRRCQARPGQLPVDALRRQYSWETVGAELVKVLQTYGG